VKVKLCPPLFATFLAILTPVFGQGVGGGIETIYQWNGAGIGDGLGGSASGAGDVNADGFNDVIAGAQKADPGGIGNAGSVYVYSGMDGSLLYQWNGTTVNERLGQSVAGAGDVNADGYDDVITCTIFAAPGGITNAGSVFVYSGADGSLLHRFDGTTADEFFGATVAGAGDINRDGFADLLVGNPYASPAGVYWAGTVLVYSGADGSLLHQWDGTATEDLLGYSISGAQDIDLDGFDDVIIGSFQSDPGGLVDAGSAYVYSGADGSVLYQWNGTNAADYFGGQVSGAGDVDADGTPDLVISAWGVDLGFSGEHGEVYVYSGADGTRIRQWRGVSANDHLGVAVSGAGDVNGDGYDDVIMSSISAFGRIEEAGSVYVYSGADSSRLFFEEGDSTDEYYGSSVSDAGDVNGDGFDDVVVGSNWNHAAGVVDAGSAFVYGFNPYLRANTATISASAGGVLDLELDFPKAVRFDDYKVLISASGTGPSYFGVLIPLTRDPLVTETFHGNYPVTVYSDLHGSLDASGNASASLTVPAGIPSALIGTSFYLAAIANQVGQMPEDSSAAVTITITP
jgi:FG-GAP repeat protein/VCBS repeat protein